MKFNILATVLACGFLAACSVTSDPTSVSASALWDCKAAPNSANTEAPALECATVVESDAPSTATEGEEVEEKYSCYEGAKDCPPNNPKPGRNECHDKDGDGDDDSEDDDDSDDKSEKADRDGDEDDRDDSVGSNSGKNSECAKDCPEKQVAKKESKKEKKHFECKKKGSKRTCSCK
ncbi:MAG: hypothetical protein KBF88_16785 [Polyangiaceae bacterium]|nr:hypothetical protein [Polyangiaceae bacterium]